MIEPLPSPRMPALFIGHGSPMNAIEDNAFTRNWHAVVQALPVQPRAILCISAHWQTAGTMVTAMEQPRTIHDFGGFPRALFEVQYPAAGSPWLANTVAAAIQAAAVGLDQDWGLDHGCWSVLKPMFPAADIPVAQLSLDINKTGAEHYRMARELAPLRQQGVLILGSGNLVHNLGRIRFSGQGPADFNQPYGLDWALEANAIFKRMIDERRHAELANYRALGPAVQLAVPTSEHFLPLLYVLAVQQEDEGHQFFNDQAVGGSLTMTSLAIGALAGGT